MRANLIFWFPDIGFGGTKQLFSLSVQLLHFLFSFLFPILLCFSMNQFWGSHRCVSCYLPRWVIARRGRCLTWALSLALKRTPDSPTNRHGCRRLDFFLLWFYAAIWRLPLTWSVPIRANSWPGVCGLSCQWRGRELEELPLTSGFWLSFLLSNISVEEPDQTQSYNTFSVTFVSLQEHTGTKQQKRFYVKIYIFHSSLMQWSRLTFI